MTTEPETREIPPAHRPEVTPLISEALTGLRGRMRRYVSVEGLSLAVAWLGVAFWLSLALDWLPVTFGYDELTLSGRLLVLCGTATVLLFIVYWLIVRRLSVSMPDRSMAVVLERRFDEYDDALLTTVELAEQPDHAQGFNPDMLRHTGDLAAEQTDHVSLSAVFNPWPLVRNLLLAAVFGMSVAGFALARADAFDTWFKRFLLLSADKWPRHNRVIVDGEYPRKIAKTDDITIRVKADGKNYELPGSVRIEYTDEDDVSRTENMTRIGEPEDGIQEYRYTIRDLRQSIKFEVVGGDYRARDKDYRVIVVDSPTAQLTLDVQYPAYTDLPPEPALSVSGTMELPRGSRVVVRGRANKPLTEAKVEISYNASEKPKVETDVLLGSSDSHEFSFPIPALHEPQDLRFSLTDVDGIRTRQPITLSLAAVDDAPPQVEAHLRGVGDAVTPQVKIPFFGKITDEYGIKAVLIEWSRPGQDPVLIPFKEDPKSRQELVFSRERAEKDPNLAEELLDFLLLARQMRMGGMGDEPLPPPRVPGEEPPKTKDDAKEDPAKKPDGKKKADDESARYTLEVGQTFTIRIIARDGCTLSRPKTEGHSSVFAFRVVTPEELRSLLAARELIQRRNFEKIRDEVTVTRNSLAAINFTPPPGSPPAKLPGAKGDKENGKAEEGRKVTAEDQRLEAFLRAQRAQQISAKNAIEVLDVAYQINLIREELENNRLYNEELNKRLKLGIADPLARIGNEMFNEFDELLNDLVDKCDKDYDNQPAREQAARLAVAQADKILDEMNSVLIKMLEFESFNEAIRLLQEIIKEADGVNQDTKKARAKSLFDP